MPFSISNISGGLLGFGGLLCWGKRCTLLKTLYFKHNFSYILLALVGICFFLEHFIVVLEITNLFDSCVVTLNVVMYHTRLKVQNFKDRSLKNGTVSFPPGFSLWFFTTFGVHNLYSGSYMHRFFVLGGTKSHQESESVDRRG